MAQALAQPEIRTPAKKPLSDAPASAAVAHPLPPESPSSSPSPTLTFQLLIDSGADLLTLAKATDLPLAEVIAWFKSDDIQHQLADFREAQSHCADLQSALNARLKQNALETLDQIHTDPEIPLAERRRAATTILRALRTPIAHARKEAGNGTGNGAHADQSAAQRTQPPSYPNVPKPGLASKRTLSPLAPLTPLDTDVPPPPIPTPDTLIASLRDAVNSANLAQLPSARDHESNPTNNPAALDAFLAHFTPEAEYEDPTEQGPDDTLRACKLPERAADLPPSLAAKLARDFVGIVQIQIFQDTTEDGIDQIKARITFIHYRRCTIATLHAKRIDQDQPSASPDWRFTKLTIEHRTGTEDTS